MSARERVVLSGGTGFLGSHLARALVRNGYAVTILKRTHSDLGRIADFASDVRLVDVQQGPLAIAFEDGPVDAVIHAACNYGRRGEAFTDVLDANVMFGSRLLEAAIEHGVQAFINTDTFFNTKALLSGYLKAYSLSKRQFVEWLTLHSDSIGVVNLRLQHMYGPGDDTTKFVPWLLDRLVENVDHIDLTRGEQRRDFIHVDDVVGAYLHFLKAGPVTGFDSYDVGTGTLTALRDFVVLARKKVAETTGTRCITDLRFGALPAREGEIVEPDYDLAPIHRTGWKAAIELGPGLESTILKMVRNGR